MSLFDYLNNAITTSKIDDVHTSINYHGVRLLIDEKTRYIDLYYLAYENNKFYYLTNMMKDDKFIIYYRSLGNLVHENKDIQHYKRIIDDKFVINKIFNIGYSLYISPKILLLLLNLLEIPIKRGYIDYLSSELSDEDNKLNHLIERNINDNKVNNSNKDNNKDNDKTTNSKNENIDKVNDKVNNNRNINNVIKIKRKNKKTRILHNIVDNSSDIIMCVVLITAIYYFIKYLRLKIYQ